MLNLEKVKNRITKLEENLFEIFYEIPNTLRDELDILIEQDISYDEDIMVEDCEDTEENNIIKGSITISLNEDLSYEEKYNIVFSRASQFEMLSNGMSLIE